MVGIGTSHGCPPFESGATMHTNFDQLARLRMEDHEADARRRDLQRHARDAAGRGTRDRGTPVHEWLLSARRLIAASLMLALPIAVVTALVP
jgi:hypothetical protein